MKFFKKDKIIQRNIVRVIINQIRPKRKQRTTKSEGKMDERTKDQKSCKKKAKLSGNYTNIFPSSFVNFKT